jgi:predicted transposase/invertase (TIGR01784 family)
MAFVRLTRFVKDEKDCKTKLDKLIFAIKNAQDLSEQPKSFKGEMFDEIFDLAKIAKFTEEERMTYEQRLKYKSVYEGNIDFARKDGRREGQKEGIAIGEARGSFRQAQKMARWMLSKGMSIADIEEATGLDEPEILALE